MVAAVTRSVFVTVVSVVMDISEVVGISVVRGVVGIAVVSGVVVVVALCTDAVKLIKYIHCFMFYFTGAL